jgi:hypothetical protein
VNVSGHSGDIEIPGSQANGIIASVIGGMNTEPTAMLSKNVVISKVNENRYGRRVTCNMVSLI